jgi:general stress protein 26
MEAQMSEAQVERAAETAPLLAAAANAATTIRYCWLATTTEAGVIKARPMGRTPRDIDEDAWIIRFMTDGRSHKAAEIRRAGDVAVIFQRSADDAYLSLAGAATVRPNAADDPRHWREAYNAYFPSERERANAVFIEIRVDRMELWIRDVTPEPFGLKPAVLERDATGGWRSVD